LATEPWFSKMMGKVAFIFPGQGSQSTGMGKDLHAAFACARETFAEADRALAFPISELCFQGPDEHLKLTHNTQPAILAVSIATLRVLEEKGIHPDYVAGHSLGEYSALVCAGAITMEQALRLVRDRGKHMQEAVPVGRGAMAAVVGLDSATVLEICNACSKYGLVSPANFNSPDQTVIAGETGAVDKASELARGRGAKRVLPLPVSAPFHCDLMAPARDRLAAELARVRFSDLRFPLVTNVDAQEVRSGAAARDALVRQVCAPVRWVESVRFLAKSGVDRFIEVGPGKVLCALVRKIAPGAQTFSVEGVRGIDALASADLGARM
jgi:[acyl-carrier-protein] S-malonyltransferase